MINISSRNLGALLLMASMLTVLGCQTPYLWLTGEYRADEEYTVTAHQQLRDLAELESSASRMSPQEQLQHLANMQQLMDRSESPTMKLAVVRAAGAFTVQPAFGLLEQALSSADANIRVAVCESLGKLQEERSLTRLLEVEGKDTDIDVRLAALRALGSYSDPRSLAALARALEDPNPAVQYRAVQSLASATEQDFGNDVPAWRKYLQQQGFATAAR